MRVDQFLALFDWPTAAVVLAVGTFLGATMTSRLATARAPGGGVTLALHLLTAFTVYFAFVTTTRFYTQPPGVAERTVGAWLTAVAFCLGIGVGIRIAYIWRARHA